MDVYRQNKEKQQEHWHKKMFTEKTLSGVLPVDTLQMQFSSQKLN
jgi:hypothetical protein